MIELEQVVRTFGDVRAVDGMDLSVRRGEVLGLLGHNGAGKTTTVRLVAGLLQPTSGRVRVGGQDPVVDGSSVRRRLGVLPANAAVDDRMTARQNLRFAADLYELSLDGLDARIEELLVRFELGGRADEPAGGFSTGMRQRLSLARVLLHDPDVLLLDEPTASLDPVAARRVRDLIAQLGARADRTIVLCTHDLAEAQRLCDRVAILEHGRIRTLGTPAELSAAAGRDAVVVELHRDDVEVALRVRSHGVAETLSSGAEAVRWPGIGREEVPHLLRVLVDSGVRVYEVERRTPTLEEVYLALHGADQPAEVTR